ncbi:MAG: GNAT family N-acetyltransferase [Bacteroidota bacterium]
MLFETARLFVRQFTKADLNDFYQLSSDAAVMQYIRPPMTREACNNLLNELIEGYARCAHFGRFGVIEKSTQQYVGNFLLRPSSFMGGTEIGFSFFQHAWSKGYGSEITRAGLAFAFRILKLEMVYAVAEKGNIASQKVLLKCGFDKRSDFIENGKALCLFEINK